MRYMDLEDHKVHKQGENDDSSRCSCKSYENFLISSLFSLSEEL